jgi:hypothetical protein
VRRLLRLPVTVSCRRWWSTSSRRARSSSSSRAPVAMAARIRSFTMPGARSVTMVMSSVRGRAMGSRRSSRRCMRASTGLDSSQPWSMPKFTTLDSATRSRLMVALLTPSAVRLRIISATNRPSMSVSRLPSRNGRSWSSEQA